MGSPAGAREYPIAAGIAYLFLSGYVWRSIFVALGLPASVGVMLSGFLFSFFSQDGIMAARDEIQELAFFIVLLIAGLEIRLADLRPYIFVLAWMPVFLEILGISACAHFWKGLPPQEGVVLGTVLAALGDGLVIPKMKEFMHSRPEHPLPRLIFMWAPLEASFVLTTFGIVTGMASPKKQAPSSLSLIVAANILRILLTVLCGTFLGGSAGWLIPRRTQFKIRGSRLFSGSDLEAFLMLLSVALFALALGKGAAGHEFVPMGFCSGSMFQPELLVIITGMVFSYTADASILHDIEHLLGQLWVFGGIILFSMLGSKTSTGILPDILDVLPIMAVGFATRLLGILLGIVVTTKARGCDSFRTVLPDTAFCFLCTLPRATIQGALGAVPLTMHFFASGGYTNKREVRDFIFVAARLYIICTSVCGMILLTTFGPKLLEATEEDHVIRKLLAEEPDDGTQELQVSSEMPEEGWESTASHLAPTEGDHNPSAGMSASEDDLEREVLQTIARKYGTTYEALLVHLQQEALAAGRSSDGLAPCGTEQDTDSSPVRPQAGTKASGGAQADSTEQGQTSTLSALLHLRVDRNLRRASLMGARRTTGRSRGTGFLMFDTNEDSLLRRASRHPTQALIPSFLRRR